MSDIIINATAIVIIVRTPVAALTYVLKSSENGRGCSLKFSLNSGSSSTSLMTDYRAIDAYDIGAVLLLAFT